MIKLINKYIFNENYNSFIIKKLIKRNFLYFISNSYEKFLDYNNCKFNLGINKILNKIFPIFIHKHNILINLVKCNIIYPKHSIKNCIVNGLTYFLTLNIKLSYTDYLYKTKLIEDTDFIEIPFITPNKTFIINGIEKCIISKITIKSGISVLKSKLNKGVNFYIKLILNDKIKFFFFIINKLFVFKFKNFTFKLLNILRYLGLNKKEIIDEFYNYEDIYYYNNKFKLKISNKKFLNFTFDFDLIKNNQTVFRKYKYISNSDLDFFKNNNINYVIINKNYFINRILGADIYYKKKKIARINEKIDYNLINKIIKYKINYFKIINFSSKHHNLISYNLSNNNFFYFLNESNKFLIKNNIILVKNKLNRDNNNFNYCEYNFVDLYKNIKNYNNIEDVLNKNYLEKKDIVNILKTLVSLNDKILPAEDFLNFKNLKINFSSDILEDFIYKELFYFKKKFITIFINNRKNLNKIINFKNLNKNILYYFNLSEYSQFLDQVNFLSELSHKRKVSVLGVKGISKNYSGFEVRDSNISHYNKLCPVETPEGINIGLINYLSILSVIDSNNNLSSFYYKIKNNNLSKKLYLLKSSDEKNLVITDYYSYKNKKIDINCRYNNQLVNLNKNLVDYVDVMGGQFLSLSAINVPFIEHNDSNRALMASNMLKQSLPVIFNDPPLINTGIENLIPYTSKNLIIQKHKSLVKFCDNKIIITEKFINSKKKIISSKEVKFIKKYINSNQNTDIGQKALLKYNDKLFPSENIVDISSSKNSILSLGKNVNVAFMTLFGYNFEDSIIVSERLLINDSFTNLNVFCLDIPIYYDDKEEFYNDKFGENKLDINGIIKIGSVISKNEIIIKRGVKVKTRKNILEVINKKEYRDSSIFLNENINNGTVTDVKIFFSKNFNLNDTDKRIFKEQNKDNKKNILYYLNFFLKKIYINKFKNFNLMFRDKNINLNFKKKLNKFLNIFLKIFINFKKKYYKNLYFNIKKIIRLKIISKSYLQVGDKMSGRHGNKGVICKILPINEMPYMKNGWPIDVILNPLGVSARMNIGQLLEVHLGLASLGLSKKIKNYMENNDINNLINLFKKIYLNKNIDNLNLKQIINLGEYLSKGVPFGIPPFSGFGEKDINYFLNLAFEGTDLEISSNRKQFYLYDGLTGKKFENPVTLGIMYMLKLNHLVENKIHSRSIGPYSLITQQPLKGKSKLGGQRLGEMEVWALQAYGAAYTLQEMMTVKSDDIKGRFEIYKNIVDGNYKFISNRPRSFDAMINNINSLGLYINFYN